MDSITINFPINDLTEVLEFIAKQCNDNHYSARDFKSDYDSAISCKDDDDYDSQKFKSKPREVPKTTVEEKTVFDELDSEDLTLMEFDVLSDLF